MKAGNSVVEQFERNGDFSHESRGARVDEYNEFVAAINNLSSIKSPNGDIIDSKLLNLVNSLKAETCLTKNLYTYSENLLKVVSYEFIHDDVSMALYHAEDGLFVDYRMGDGYIYTSNYLIELNYDCGESLDSVMLSAPSSMNALEDLFTNIKTTLPQEFHSEFLSFQSEMESVISKILVGFETLDLNDFTL